MTRRRRAYLGLVAAAVLFVLLMLLFAQQAWWERFLESLFPEQRTIVYGRHTLLELAVQHLEIVAWTLVVILVLGIPLGIVLTRGAGRAFLPLGSNLLSVGQTFPPVAVLALALPYFGFGLTSTLIALVAYGLLPVARNTIAGLEAVPRDLTEAARGMGMGGRHILMKLELPMATRVILAGVRISAIYTIGTATVAPIVGAGGLGVPIIAGLATSNPSLVLQGALPVAMLALVIDFALGRLEQAVVPAGLQQDPVG